MKYKDKINGWCKRKASWQWPYEKGNTILYNSAGEWVVWLWLERLCQAQIKQVNILSDTADKFQQKQLYGSIEDAEIVADTGTVKVV